MVAAFKRRFVRVAGTEIPKSLMLGMFGYFDGKQLAHIGRAVHVALGKILDGVKPLTPAWLIANHSGKLMGRGRPFDARSLAAIGEMLEPYRKLPTLYADKLDLILKDGRNPSYGDGRTRGPSSAVWEPERLYVRITIAERDEYVTPCGRFEVLVPIEHAAVAKRAKLTALAVDVARTLAANIAWVTPACVVKPDDRYGIDAELDELIEALPQVDIDLLRQFNLLQASFFTQPRERSFDRTHPFVFVGGALAGKLARRAPRGLRVERMRDRSIVVEAPETWLATTADDVRRDRAAMRDFLQPLLANVRALDEIRTAKLRGVDYQAHFR